MKANKHAFFFFCILFCVSVCHADERERTIVIASLNCENLFDTLHDEGKDDYEFLSTSERQWTKRRFWQKITNIGREILSSGTDEHIPDIVALQEVENDTALYYLCHRSILRNAGYEYIITSSNDSRGINVALLYRPNAFRITDTLSLDFPKTRSVLNIKGETIIGDTLSIYVVHLPSLKNSNRKHNKLRLHIADKIIHNAKVDKNVIIIGDFNDYTNGHIINHLCSVGFVDATKDAPPRGDKRVKGSYKFRGQWGSLDHILIRGEIVNKIVDKYIVAPPFLLIDDANGNVAPRRTYRGTFYQGGYSDHLPIVITIGK